MTPSADTSTNFLPKYQFSMQNISMQRHLKQKFKVILEKPKKRHFSRLIQDLKTEIEIVLKIGLPQFSCNIVLRHCAKN